MDLPVEYRITMDSSFVQPEIITRFPAPLRAELLIG